MHLLECIYKGEKFQSGAEWSDADDPCSHYKCVAGVVTESVLQCYTPCSNPLPPRHGQCCPTCLGELNVSFFFVVVVYELEIVHVIKSLSLKNEFTFPCCSILKGTKLKGSTTLITKEFDD